MGKKPPASAGVWVRSLGQEDPLEEEMATSSSILAWKLPWTEESGRLHIVHGVAMVRIDRVSEHAHTHWLCELTFSSWSP